MANTAVLVGIAKYASLSDLPCCKNDVDAVGDLLESTRKFESIIRIYDATSDEIRSGVREALASHIDVDEFYFFFSGHGVQLKGEFYYCGADFDVGRPNETGLSNNELHTLLRSCDPQLVVKVIDACNSGTSLIKGDVPLITDGKGVLNNVIQIASCQSSQVSLAGTPLSLFTRHFCGAALRKQAGPVYYMDLINSLRDDFLDDNEQTPHFVSQGTGRELFVDDASHLEEYRLGFAKKWQADNTQSETSAAANTTSQGMLQLIQEAEKHYVAPADADIYISKLFDGIIKKINTNDFSNFYEIEVIEHDEYKEETARAFMLQSLSRETRPDHFVTAARKKSRNQNYISNIAASLAFGLMEDFNEDWDLKLNCSIKRAQIKVTLNPKYKSLNQIKLVVSCAPSLNHCYVFEVSTIHVRRNWEWFDPEGSEISRHWYQRVWTEDNDWMSSQICERVHAATKKHVETTAKRLGATKEGDDGID